MDITGIQLDVIHVEEVSDGYSTSEPVSVATFVMIWLTGFRPMPDSSWDREKIIVTCTIRFEFLMKDISVLVMLYSPKHSSIHVYVIK